MSFGFARGIGNSGVNASKRLGEFTVSLRTRGGFGGSRYWVEVTNYAGDTYGAQFDFIDAAKKAYNNLNSASAAYNFFVVNSG